MEKLRMHFCHAKINVIEVSSQICTWLVPQMKSQFKND